MLSAQILVIYPTLLHYCSLQYLKNRALKASCYNTPISISPLAQEDLQQWTEHLGSWNGRTILSAAHELVIETDAYKKGWGAYSQGEFTGGCWAEDKKMLHINTLELITRTEKFNWCC